MNKTIMSRFTRILRSAKWPLASVAALVLGYGAYFAYLLSTNNFHVVVPGQVYRAAQPTGEEIESYYDHYGIKTIINLRGGNLGHAWYRDELNTLRILGIQHIDFSMSAREIQPPEKLERLIAILADAPKPILIHCNWGSDRTGLAAALYLAAIAKAPELTAEAQLSIMFGHFPLPFVSQAYPMDQSFEAMESQFGYTGTAWDYILPPIRPRPSPSS